MKLLYLIAAFGWVVKSRLDKRSREGGIGKGEESGNNREGECVWVAIERRLQCNTYKMFVIQLLLAESDKGKREGYTTGRLDDGHAVFRAPVAAYMA